MLYDTAGGEWRDVFSTRHRCHHGAQGRRGEAPPPPPPPISSTTTPLTILPSEGFPGVGEQGAD